MRYYKRKDIYSLLFILIGVFFLISGLFKYETTDYKTGLSGILIAPLFFFNAYLYRKPYLGLDDEKLIINNGLWKEELLLNIITSSDWTNKKLKLYYTQGSLTHKLTISLSMLKENERDQFEKELGSRLKVLDQV